MKRLLIGLAIGLTLPLAIDYLLFGTVQPCKTAQVFEDGSSILHCSVRD